MSGDWACLGPVKTMADSKTNREPKLEPRPGGKRSAGSSGYTIPAQMF